ASPTATTTYVLTATSAAGCTLRDTLTVNISGVAPRVNAISNPDTVCPGGTVMLDLTVLPSSCGLAASPCLSGNTNYTIGTATTTTTTTTPYYGFWHDARLQFLYRATELQAQG